MGQIQMDFIGEDLRCCGRRQRRPPGPSLLFRLLVGARAGRRRPACYLRMPSLPITVR